MYRIIFLVVRRSSARSCRPTNVLDFGDLMILVMAFPNILGLYFLGGEVKADLAEYERKLQAGEFKVYK